MDNEQDDLPCTMKSKVTTKEKFKEILHKCQEERHLFLLEESDQTDLNLTPSNEQDFAERKTR